MEMASKKYLEAANSETGGSSSSNAHKRDRTEAELDESEGENASKRQKQ
jgi:hypothetical protein